MASRIPKETKGLITDGWWAEPLRVALFKSTSNCNTDGIYLFADCLLDGNEVATSGSYTSGVGGGALLTGKTSTWVDGTNAQLDAADTQFTTVTWASPNAPRYAVVYNATTGVIRFVYDFAAEKVVTGGTFTIQWAAGGLVKVSSTP